MPKNWQVYKHEIESLYLTQGRTLEEVRKILKERHHFEASTRAYRMKLDEWQLWKNKSNRFNRISYSEPSKTPERVMDTSNLSGLGTIGSSPSTQDGDDIHVALSPMSTNGAPSMTEAYSSPSAPPYWRMLHAKWRAGDDLRKQAKIILEQDGTSTSVFKLAQSAHPEHINLFDEICSNVSRFEDLEFAKAFILACFELPLLPNQSSPWNLRLGLNAFRQHDWTQFKNYLFNVSDLSRCLCACMSTRAANLVLDSIFFLVGDRLLERHKAVLDSYHHSSLSSSSNPHFKPGDYEFHRREYVGILKDFRDRRRSLGMPSSWEEFLLDLMERPAFFNGSGGQLGDPTRGALHSDRVLNGGHPS